MKKLSIIIPVYNTAAYVEKCLKSCLNQDLSKDKYEIIVVDDGSTDNSAGIIKDFQNNHSNIVFIQKENGGVSSARNKGIEVAKGKYVTFVDSDDVVKENSLNEIFTSLDTYNSDLTIMNSFIPKKDDVNEYRYPFPKELVGKCYSGIELFRNMYSRGSVCGVFFKIDFILENKLMFSEELRNGEDSLFMSMSFLYAVTIRYFDLDFYSITEREGSASRSWNYNRVEKMLDGLSVIADYIKSNDLSNDQLAILNISAYGRISNTLFNFFNLSSLKEYYTLKNRVVNSPMYPIKSYGAKQFKSKIALLNFSYDLFCLPFILRGFYFKLK